MTSLPPHFKRVKSGSPHLEHARLSNCAEKLLAYAENSGGLDLTPFDKLELAHVSWAEEAFGWPGYTSDDETYASRSARSEQDMFPLAMIHLVLRVTKHVRHFRKRMLPTASGRKLIGHPHRAFYEITPRYLFGIDHAATVAGKDRMRGYLRDYLDVLNVFANDWVTIEEIAVMMFGPAPTEWDARPVLIYTGAIQPLVWAGLMLEAEDGSKKGLKSGKTLIRKSPLWPEALALDSDSLLDPSADLH